MRVDGEGLTLGNGVGEKRESEEEDGREDHGQRSEGVRIVRFGGREGGRRAKEGREKSKRGRRGGDGLEGGVGLFHFGEARSIDDRL